MIIVDAHQDLAYNMLSFGRDYSQSAYKTRQREISSPTPQRNDDTLLGWPEYQRGKVAVLFSTLFVAPLPARVGEWETQIYADSNQAYQLYRAQLEAYFRMVDNHPDKFHLVRSLSGLETVLDAWQNDQNYGPKPDGALELGSGEPSLYVQENEGEEFRGQGRPVGLVPLMEGAEGVRSPGELEEWWEMGLRLIGPAWAGTRFCGGTRMPGPLTSEGRALLEAMAAIGFGLDLSHMDEQAVLQAVESYPGVVFASHANAHALLKGMETNRHLSDRVIEGIIERDGVIGVVPYNRFLLPGWQPADGRTAVTLQHVFAHIDYICQVAGDALHVGIGTDFDGGFGLQSVPAEIDTIADLVKLVPLMQDKGYSEKDIAAIMGLNWISVLKRILPEGE
jgi:membrane dipeptidase